MNLKGKLTAKMDITGRVAKFVDCRSKDVEERELFIVEGDSALGSVKQARDPNYQAIMPIRGKILNCLKADYDKIFKSEIITDLIKVLGCGVQVKSKANKSIGAFDINALRWNKVILCTDADVDGFHIRTMLLTMLYRLTPDLIRQDKVFIAESPLYEITCKDKTYFAYNEREKEQFLQELAGQKFTIQRSKGLGENDPEMMNLTTMNPQDPAAHPGEARRCGAGHPDVRRAVGGQPERPEGLYRRTRGRIPGRPGRVLKRGGKQRIWQRNNGSPSGEAPPKCRGFIAGAGEIVQQDISDTLRQNFMPYAMSVILSRAIPEIDGFKPSHRKLLFTMYKMGLLGSAGRKVPTSWARP